MLLILLSMAAALAVEASRLGVTVDEPGHIVSAHLYWQGEDTLLPGDMPPLIKIAGGWPSLWFRPPVPRDNEALWASRQEAPIGAEMLMRMSDTPGLAERFLLASRLPFLFFPLATAALVWWWGRQLFGAATGVVLAAMFAMEPTALGHGALFKNDLAATFGYTVFWYRAWRYWRSPSQATLRWMAAALALALLSKLSMVVLAPLLLLIVAAREWPSGAAIARGLLQSTAIAYVLVAAAYQSMIPFAYRDALVSIWQSNADSGGVYLWGRVLDAGHEAYFLAALAVKAPVALQLMVLTGAIVLVSRYRRLQPADAFWLFPPLLYIACASASNLQLGIRLILPALPFGVLISGAAVPVLLQSRARSAMLAGALLWLSVVSVRIFPHGISFFNTWTGGPEAGLNYLADSNIDWGQGLPALAEYRRAHPIGRFRLSYFGLDNPWRFFREDEFEAAPPPWEPSMAKGEVWKPEPGYYAISASLLPGSLFHPPYRDYYRFFRNSTPIARVAHSIYLYRVGDPRVSSR